MAASSRFVVVKALRLLNPRSWKSSRWTPLIHRTIHTPNILICKQAFKDYARYTFQRHISVTGSVHSKVMQFKLSDIGEGIREVSVKEWFVKEGDRVAQFENICEVQSDKASVTITSRYDGIITKLYHEVDSTALVGEPLVDIQLDESATQEIDHTESSSSSDVSDSESSSDDEASTDAKFLATPAVRKLASDKSVKLADVVGSGKKGRILKDDVFAHLEAKDSLKTVPAATIHPLPPSSSSLTASAAPPSTPAFLLLPSTTPHDRTEAITGMRRAMVKSMTAANNIPHFCFCDQVDMTSLVSLKETFKQVAGTYAIKFSYTSIFVKAASMALSRFPLLNSSVDEECKNITYKGQHNIGVAIDSIHGLVVPNIKNVASLSVLEVAVELDRLNRLASAGKLAPSDITGGTFTLSNIGMIGGTYTKPVIFVPEVVIGALGSITKTPVYDSVGNVVPAHLMSVSWSADHRVVDGATMARFSNQWKAFLQQPASLLLHLR